MRSRVFITAPILLLLFSSSPPAHATQVRTHTADGGSSITQKLALHHGPAKYASYHIHGDLAAPLSEYRAAFRVERLEHGQWNAFGRGVAYRIQQAPQPHIDFAARISPTRPQLRGLESGRFRLRGSTTIPSKLTLRL